MATPLERIFAQDAVRLLTHADAAVRGEAALIVAAERSMRDHSALLTLTRDKDETARLYGILSLGLLGTPGVSHTLRSFLDGPQVRAEPTGIAAAFALGCLPPEESAGLVNEVLSGYLRGSSKRQRDALVALLLALRHRPQPAATPALRRLFDEDSARDLEVQGLLLQVLLPADASLRGTDLLRILQRGGADERIAVLEHVGDALRHDAPAGHGELDATLRDLARPTSGGDAGVRAAALTAMARHRLPQTLDLAVEALAAKDPRELTAAMHVVLSLGGASMRQVLERHVLSTVEPARKTALLMAFAAPPSPTLLDDCAGLAADRKADFEVRRAAAFLLARAAPQRAGAVLRELFLEDQDAVGRRSLAAALLRTPGAPPSLSQLLGEDGALRDHPQDWHALLGAGHPQAERQLLALLGERSVSAAELVPALRAWRCRAALSLPRADAQRLPAAIARILEDGP